MWYVVCTNWLDIYIEKVTNHRMTNKNIKCNLDLHKLKWLNRGFWPTLTNDMCSSVTGAWEGILIVTESCVVFMTSMFVIGFSLYRVNSIYPYVLFYSSLYTLCYLNICNNLINSIIKLTIFNVIYDNTQTKCRLTLTTILVFCSYSHKITI